MPIKGLIPPLLTLLRKGGNLEILEGLITNDKIIKEGLSRLADGMIVKPLMR